MSDEYEARFMAGGTPPLHREKIVWKWGAALFTASAAFAVAVSGAMLAIDPSPVVLLPLVPATALGGAALLFSVLRVAVTAQSVHVQLGPAGPSIPVAGIESVEVRRYAWERYGGWGVRLGLDGSWAYSIPGVGRGVRIVWRDERGRSRTAFVSSREPEQLAEAILRARDHAPRGIAVRVASDVGKAEADDEPVESAEAGAKRRARGER